MPIEALQIDDWAPAVIRLCNHEQGAVTPPPRSPPPLLLDSVTGLVLPNPKLMSGGQTVKLSGMEGPEVKLI